MTPRDPVQVVDAHLKQGIQFMRAYEKETCLLGTLMHHEPEWAPHEVLANYEAAAERAGLHLIYVGSEVHTYDSNEPLYYVFLSQKESLTLDEIKGLLPGYEPVHPQEWSEVIRHAA